MSIFQVIVFSTRVKSLGVFEGTPVGIQSGVGKVKRLKSFGGTNINDALITAIKGASKFQKQEGLKQVNNFVIGFWI